MKKLIISENQYKLLFENLNDKELSNVKSLLDSKDETNVQLGIQILDANEYPITDFIEKFYSKTIYRPFSNTLLNNLSDETILNLLKSGFELNHFPNLNPNVEMEYINFTIDEGTNEQMFSLGKMGIILDTFTIKYLNKTYPEKLENYLNGYITHITNEDFYTLNETLLDFFNENNLELYMNSTDTLESNVLYQMSKVAKSLLPKYLENKINQAIETNEVLRNNEEDYFKYLNDQNLINQYYEKFKEYYED